MSRLLAPSCACLAFAGHGQPCVYAGSEHTNPPVTQGHLKMKRTWTPFLWSLLPSGGESASVSGRPWPFPGCAPCSSRSPGDRRGGPFGIKYTPKVLLTSSHYWTFPPDGSKGAALRGPETEKFVKKGPLTRRLQTVFEHRIFSPPRML